MTTSHFIVVLQSGKLCKVVPKHQSIRSLSKVIDSIYMQPAVKRAWVIDQQDYPLDLTLQR